MGYYEEKKKYYLIIALIILLIIIALFSFFQYEKITTLKKEIENLRLENENLNVETTKLSKDLTIIQGEIQSNINLLNKYQEEIETSMEWFNINSVSTGRFTTLYLDRCYDYSSKKCKIKLGCLFLINSEYLGLEYKFDVTTSKQEDKLQSLSEFLNNKGGDCEDYSLFYKAEYNYILQDCLSKGANNFELESYENSSNSLDFVWLDFNDVWYIEHVDEKIIPSGYIYPNIVCGNIYDLNFGNITGHCMVAFTKNKINELGDLQELNQAPLIEPQTGEFMGLINDISSEVYLLEENGKIYPSSYIYEVITDKDLFYFIENKNWVSYSGFKENLGAEEQKLLQLVN